MAVDFFDKAAVEKLSKDYIAARDAGNKELADRLYFEMREMHKRMSKEGWTFREPVIGKMRAKKKSRKNKKAKMEHGEEKYFNMREFAALLRNAEPDVEPFTVSSVSSRFDVANIQRVEQALELASLLGVIRKRGKSFYKTYSAPSNAYDIMSNIQNRKIHLKIEQYKKRRNGGIEQASNELEFMPGQVDLQNESLRLGMSESAYEGGHGRKKSDEYNDKIALENSRDRYGLNKKDILEFDLD